MQVLPNCTRRRLGVGPICLLSKCSQLLGLLHSDTNEIKQPRLHVAEAHKVREVLLTQGQWNIERRQEKG
jgi:hypothetical protein